LRRKHKVKIKVNAEIDLSSAEKTINNLDILMAIVYIKGGKDVQVSIEELADYLHDNADKIENCHQQTA